MSESSESTGRSDDEAINTAKAALLLAGGRWTADLELSCRRVLRGEKTVEEELNHFRQHLRTSEYQAEAEDFWANMSETTGTDEARKINMDEAEAFFVQDGIEE